MGGASVVLGRGAVVPERLLRSGRAGADDDASGGGGGAVAGKTRAREEARRRSGRGGGRRHRGDVSIARAAIGRSQRELEDKLRANAGEAPEGSNARARVQIPRRAGSRTRTRAGSDVRRAKISRPGRRATRCDPRRDVAADVRFRGAQDTPACAGGGDEHLTASPAASNPRNSDGVSSACRF